MQLTLDRFGRVLLPKPLRDELGLAAGDNMELEERDGGVWMKPVRTQDSVAQKAGLLVFTGEPTGDIEKAVASHRRERTQRVARWRKRP